MYINNNTDPQTSIEINSLYERTCIPHLKPQSLNLDFKLFTILISILRH